MRELRLLLPIIVSYMCPFRNQKKKKNKVRVKILKSEWQWQILSTINSVPVKAVAKGQNKIIKEVSEASRSLIRNHILLKV